jgi:hypothetical protein
VSGRPTFAKATAGKGARGEKCRGGVYLRPGIAGGREARPHIHLEFSRMFDQAIAIQGVDVNDLFI